ncbi:hypothetical protein THTE_0755 [Thermogutta terrifontis]|uniref:Uncharacterized protein n=1 Tax=Thermogutta terrifontis TaxID=1331910 RepID=A0A286RBQ5_9BACT|nr:hypothetical protein THTE_0755 [Thermogutta terrifontis]
MHTASSSLTFLGKTLKCDAGRKPVLSYKSAASPLFQPSNAI